MNKKIVVIGNTIFFPVETNKLPQDAVSTKYINGTYGCVWLGEVFTREEVVERAKSFHKAVSNTLFNIANYEYAAVKPVKAKDDIWK